MADILPFATTESQRRSNRSAQARNGRKLLAGWREAVETRIQARELIDIDGRFADALMNFPSSVLSGYCWAGQARFATKLSRSISTIERSVARFKRSRLLHVEQRGNGRTCRYTFVIDDQLVIAQTAPSSVKDQAPALLKGLKASAPASVRDESCKLTESNESESPPNPPTAPDQAETQAGQPKIASADSAPLDGEVLGPEAEVDFDRFWGAIRGRPGPSGPAVAQWRKLSRDERAAIGNLIGPHGLDLDGMWATTWLADRRWEKASLRSSDYESALAALRAAAGRTSAGPAVLTPYSDEWVSERERMVAAGESVAFMESQAARGIGWTIRA